MGIVFLLDTYSNYELKRMVKTPKLYFCDMVYAANIRLSTMDLSILSQNKIVLVTLDEKYLPTAVVLPFEGNARQSMLMHTQVGISKEKYRQLWVDIIKQKISNQARALSIIGVEGTDNISSYISQVNLENVDYIEAIAAKEYFSYYHVDLNRRTEDPINSRLNYGYAIIRSYIARSLVASGFHPIFGIHHSNQLNAFNLADDLIIELLLMLWHIIILVQIQY